MKRLKFYLSMILVVCILASTSTVALASNISWIMNPVPGVETFVYGSRSTAYGFIIKGMKDGKKVETLVGDNGVVIEPIEYDLSSQIDENGYIHYYPGDYTVGIMDLNGKIVIQGGVYSEISILNKDRFVVRKETEDKPKFALIDADENEIVPFDKYTILRPSGTVLALDDDYNCVALIDYDGNIILDTEEVSNVTILPATDRYLYYDELANMSYIRALDGSVISEIEGKAVLRMDNFIQVHYLDEENDTMYFYLYDMDGTATDVKVYENYSKNSWSISHTLGGDLNSKYSVIRDGSHEWYVVDNNDNVVFRDPELMVLEIYDDKYIKVTDSSWKTKGLLTISGEMVVPLGEYVDIQYCEELDIFSFDRDGEIAIGKIKDVNVKLDGEEIAFDQTPIIKEGRTLVPMRAIFEAFGADIYWDDATKTVTSNFNGITVTLKIGSNVMKVNDKEITLDVPAEILNGRTIVPVRAISEAFECNVDWDDATKTVLITR